MQKNSPAAIAGLKSGDRILSIDGNLVEEWADISIFLQASKGSQVKILLENQGSKREVVAFPIQRWKVVTWDFFTISSRKFFFFGLCKRKLSRNHKQRNTYL